MVANVGKETFVPRYAPNKMPTEVKKRYFDLIRQGLKGAEAAWRVGVSTGCGETSARPFAPKSTGRKILSSARLPDSTSKPPVGGGLLVGQKLHRHESRP